MFGKRRERGSGKVDTLNAILTHYYSIFLGGWQWQRYGYRQRFWCIGFATNKASWSEKADPWKNTVSTVTCPLLTTQWPNQTKHSLTTSHFLCYPSLCYKLTWCMRNFYAESQTVPQIETLKRFLPLTPWLLTQYHSSPFLFLSPPTHPQPLGPSLFFHVFIVFIHAPLYIYYYTFVHLSIRS